LGLNEMWLLPPPPFTFNGSGQAAAPEGTL
jgi:hypothetical protein